MVKTNQGDTWIKTRVKIKEVKINNYANPKNMYITYITLVLIYFIIMHTPYNTNFL